MGKVERVRKYRDAIEARLLIENAVCTSDDELMRCLESCVGGERLVEWAKILRDAGELKNLKKDKEK